MDSVWYVAYTRPQKEAVVAHSAAEKGFDTFLPWALEPGKKARPLFPRYVLVRVERNQDWWPLMRCQGVSNLISDTNGFPKPVYEEEIAKLRSELGPGDTVKLATKARPANFAKGESVQIIDGQFRGLGGEVVKVFSRDRVRILLDMVGRKTAISVPAASLVGG